MPAAFTFCPRCATRLGLRDAYGALRPVCAACGFVQFFDPKVAVVALVTLPGRVLLIRRAVNPGRGLWALPGGYIDAGEMPAAALQRELREEVGLTVQVGALLDIYALEVQGEARGIVLAYAATPLAPPTADVPLRAADDVAEARWFAADALPVDLAFDSTHTLLAHWAAGQHA